MLGILRVAFAQADYDLCRELCWEEDNSGAVGSVVVTDMVQRLVHVANVGDCDVKLLSFDGPGPPVRLVSQKHRLENESEQQRLNGLSAVTHEDRLWPCVRLLPAGECAKCSERKEFMCDKCCAKSGASDGIRSIQVTRSL